MKEIYQLVINITDICSMNCAHCLRGGAKGRKMDLSLIPKIFDGIDYIGSLTITGGEPSCYVEAVTAIKDYLMSNDSISVGGCFIVTNGKEYKEELVDIVKSLLWKNISSQYRKDDEGNILLYGVSDYERRVFDSEEISGYFNIAISRDQFHDPIPLENYFKYRMSGVYSDLQERSYKAGDVIARGNGENVYGAEARPVRKFYIEKEDDNYINAEEIYISIDGNVFSDCDISYEMEETEECIGNVRNETLAEILQRYVDEKEKEEEAEEEK